MSMLSDPFIDTSVFNSSLPMCMLISIHGSCSANMMGFTSPDFPIVFHFDSDKTTNHCHHQSVPQIMCANQFVCPQKVQCNLKYNGYTDYRKWSWDCNSPHGSIYYESCNGNRDTSCVNIDSFHFRHDGVAPPEKLADVNNKRNHIEDSRTYFDKVSDAVTCFGAFLIMLLGTTALIIAIVGFVSLLGDAGLGILIGGIIGALIFGGESSTDTSDGSWHDTLATCDD